MDNDEYREYEELLLERERLLQEVEQIWIRYNQLFGQLKVDIYTETVECIRLKKIIACYQQALNRGVPLDQEQMDARVEREMQAYYAKLRRMTDDTKKCLEAESRTEYEDWRAKMIYRRLAKLLHPDLRPETDMYEDLKELWMRVQRAYRGIDLRELSRLEVLARRMLRDLGISTDRADIPDLEERSEELREEIQDIVGTEPYTFRDMLRDDEAVREYRDSLQSDLEARRQHHERLNQVIRQFFENGGIFIKWETT